MENLRIEEAKIKEYVSKLENQINNFNNKVGQMMKGTEKLEAVYPNLFRAFCQTDHRFEVDGQNLYEELDKSQKRVDKKYSLYATNTGKKMPRLTKNKSMNFSLFEKPAFKTKRSSLAYSKNTDQPKLAQSKENAPRGNRTGNGRSEFLGTNSRAAQGGIHTSIKISVISNSETVNKENKFNSEDDNRKLEMARIKSNRSEEFGGGSEKSVSGKKSGRLVHTLTSKSIFQSVKPSNLSDSETVSLVQKKPEITTYAQLIEKTGKFNIIPDINRNPVYNHFQQKLDELLGTSTHAQPRINLNALSIQSSNFNLRIEHDHKKSEHKNSQSKQFSKTVVNQTKSELKSLSEENLSNHSLATSLFLNVHSAKRSSSSQVDEFLAGEQNEIIEALKMENMFWEELVSKSKIEHLIDQFEVNKCEKLFLDLVFIFEADLSNIVPQFTKIIEKLKCRGPGETDQSGPLCTETPRTNRQLRPFLVACQVN